MDRDFENSSDKIDEDEQNEMTMSGNESDNPEITRETDFNKYRDGIKVSVNRPESPKIAESVMKSGSPTTYKKLQSSLDEMRQEQNASNIEQIVLSNTKTDTITKKSLVEESYENKTDKQNYIIGNILTPVLFLIFAILIGCYCIYYIKNESADNNPVGRFCYEFENLQEKYQNQNPRLWKDLKSGVDSVLNRKPTKPSVFMLVYDYETNISELFNDIVNATELCLGNNVPPLRLTYEELTKPEIAKDYGYAITVYKEPLYKSGILVVEEFDRIPPYIAQAFHTFCDIETPIVARSIIFLTMKINIVKDESPRLINKATQNKLMELWENLGDNVLEPLLVRVTDQILLLK